MQEKLYYSKEGYSNWNNWEYLSAEEAREATHLTSGTHEMAQRIKYHRNFRAGGRRCNIISSFSDCFQPKSASQLENSSLYLLTIHVGMHDLPWQMGKKKKLFLL